VLEQFKVGHDEAEFVQGDTLKSTVADIFRHLGVPADDAELGADVLVLEDLRGVDSHGVSNMLRSYVSGYQDGSINPRPDWKVIRETPSTATVDSDRGLGTIITPKAMGIAIEKARSVGVGMVAIGNARHLGMASYHSMLALEHDMIGVCMTSCPPAVLPTFGAEPRLGTNPIAVAVPTGTEAPFVFDAATSSVAVNKIRIAQRLGADIPPGWPAPALAPVGILALWGSFSLMSIDGLGWLRGKRLLAAALGAVGAPFAYIGGISLGAGSGATIEFYLLVALFYGAATPLLVELGAAAKGGKAAPGGRKKPGAT